MEKMATEEQGGTMAMVRRVFKWLVNLFTGHTVLQLIATVPTAYLTGLALQFQQEAEAVFSAIPPLFWPVLAVLVLAVTVCPGFVLPFVTLVRAPKEKYRAQVETAYEWVVCAYKPWILTSEHPDNSLWNREEAQRAVDSLSPILIRKYKNRKDVFVGCVPSLVEKRRGGRLLPTG